MNRSRPRALARRVGTTLGVAALAATLVPGLPASAGSPAHTGVQGVHALLDAGDTEYPGQDCQYQDETGEDPGQLRRIAVRRPIIFARDTTSGRDQQWVGWRFTFLRDTGGEPVPVHTSRIVKAIAYDDRPAALEPRGKKIIGVEGANYITVVESFWYTRTSSTNQTGSSRHAVKYSEISGPTDGLVSGSCAGSILLKGAARARPAGKLDHGGEVGLHALVDEPLEFPGVTCVYDGLELVRIRVRAPVVWAVDDTPGTDVQDVRWRYEIGLAQDESGFDDTIIGAWTRAEATELRAARWRGQKRTVDGSNFNYWVVSVRIEWLGSAPRPFAEHSPYHKVGSNITGYCLGELV